jgi:flagellar hook-associated protein 1 FlgK
MSGVDLDQEAADLLRFQQAYAGSARVIQTARETLESILNIF